MNSLIKRLLLGYALSAVMFLSREWVVEILALPEVLYKTLGVASGIAFYLLVNTPAEGSENNRQYQWLALILAAVYAFAAFGNYSPVALLSTGPILIGCAAALRHPTHSNVIALKSGTRFWVISAGAACMGIAIALLWEPIFPGNLLILWVFGGIGLLAEAIAQIWYTGGKITPRQFRFGQTLANGSTILGCLAQSNSGSVAFNAATLLAMLLFTITDRRI